jgi:hypothetical protein
MGGPGRFQPLVELGPGGGQQVGKPTVATRHIENRGLSIELQRGDDLVDFGSAPLVGQ